MPHVFVMLASMLGMQKLRCSLELLGLRSGYGPTLAPDGLEPADVLLHRAMPRRLISIALA